MELTSTTQSRNKFLYLGYAYVKNKDLANGWVSFECERRRNYKGCTGRIKANGQQVVVVTNHTHTPNPARTLIKCSTHFPTTSIMILILYWIISNIII